MKPSLRNQIITFLTRNVKYNNSGIRDVLKINGFKKLWIGQIFSQLADKFYIVLMIYIIAQYWIGVSTYNNEALADVAAAMRMNFDTRTQQITLLATGIYSANTIPAIFFGALAGIGVDRWQKKRLMVSSNALRALLVIFTPICLIPGPSFLGISWGYWALIVMTFFESVLTQFFAPAEQAAIPLIVPKENLLAANSLYQATSMGATIIGFALGDPILRLLKQIFLGIGISGGEFLLLPFCYGMAAITLSTIKIKEEAKKKHTGTVWQEISEGLLILKRKTTVRNAMINLVILYCLLAALYVLTISLASSIDSLGPTRFGTLLAMSGLGMALGSIVLAQIGHIFSRRILASSGLGAITLCLVLLGEARGSLTITLILCTLLGFSAALVAIPAQTTLHEDTPENQRGKIFGLQNNLINISLSLPLVLSGALVSKYGVIPVLWILACLSLLASLLERPWKRC